MRIKRLHIENYKVFENLDLHFTENSAVIFGVNGVGKSTILAAINYIYRIFLNQMTPSQSKAFGKFRDDMISVGKDRLEIQAQIKLGNETHTLARMYHATKRNSRSSEITYPKVNYSHFKDVFTAAYLDKENAGMPIFVHYGTNRTVIDIPDRIREKHQFDKLSAIERAMDLQLDFRTFFEWYREKEAEEVLFIKESDHLDYVDPALLCVRKAIETMMGDVSGLQIKRNPVRMVVNKAGKEIRVDMLSDGEKCTLALLGDLARRLVLANPHAENPLEGSGIVLIDEIELHMHPSWQRSILHVLRNVFPNIQFFITTHSPQVLGEAGSDYDIISLKLDQNGRGYAVSGIRQLDGFDSNMILEEYMDTPSESDKKKSLVKEINESIRKNDFVNAEKRLEELKALAGDDDAEYIMSKGYLGRKRSL